MRATVAIVGRPNVGKSTLFNRLLGRRQAIVHDLPGVTRDRITGSFELDERFVDLIDTGGLVPGDDPLGLNKQVLLAVEESDLLLFVVDGREGLVAADETVWEEFRAANKPAVLVVNKADTRAAQEAFHEFYQLGLDAQVLVSAEHALGIEELTDEISARLPLETEAPMTAPALAVVGRPNVGKSSIVNRLIGSGRSLVSPVAGTTRDPVDTLLEREGANDWLLVDTAGIRRRSQVSGTPEELAVMMARRQIERARLVVLVLDAEQGVTSGDLAIAGTIWERGRAALVVVNKWDLLDETRRQDLEEGFERLQEVLYKPPRLNVSALTGRGIAKLLPAVDALWQSFNTEIPTADVNRLFERAVERHHAPSVKGKPWNLLYATQVSTAPPTFMLFANRTLKQHDTYRRYLENTLRRELDLPGVPVRLVVRKRSR